MTTTTTTCPSWCSEHPRDEFGAITGHVAPVDTGFDWPGAYVDVQDDPDPQPDSARVALGGLEGAALRPRDARRLAAAILRAAEIAEGPVSDPSPEELVTTIRGAIKEAGLSQRQVADITGIPLPTLSRRLTGGGHGLTVPEIFVIAEATGQTPGELFRAAGRLAARAKKETGR